MTKIEFALHIVNRLRAEKNPPMLRISVLLSLAASGKPVLHSKITKDLDLGRTSITGTLDSAIRLELIQTTSKQSRTYYSLTPKGEDIVRDLLTAPEPASA